MGEDTHEIPRKPPVPAIFTDSVLQSRIKEARKKGYEERLVLYNQELAYHQGRWQLVVSLFECPNCGQSGDFKGATDYCTKMQTARPDRDSDGYTRTSQPPTTANLHELFSRSETESPHLWSCTKCTAVFENPECFTAKCNELAEALAEYDQKTDRSG